MVKRNFFIFGLILLVGFLILPEICLAVDLEDIDLREIGKYLGLPESKVQELIRSLIQIFHSEWETLITSPYFTPEKSAVPSIMKKAVQVQALNHLLIDAPLQISWGIINNALKIARLIGAKDITVILNELEKESVKKATEYGMKFLLQNEIRVTPGAISFEYVSQKGNPKEALFQYIMIYKPINTKRGEVLIRFYSPAPLEPPKNEMSYGAMRGIYTELTHDLPPFIVDIRGTVEDYKWVGNPTIDIDFPPEVPDLGIRPLSFWERNILQPILTTIKEIEIIITKVTGGSTKIGENLSKISKFVSDAWNTIKSTLSQFNPFGAEVGQSLPSFTPEDEETDDAEQLAEFVTPQVENKEEIGEPRPLDDAQEQLDDIAERIDILDAEMAKLITQATAKGENENLSSSPKEKDVEEEKKEGEIVEAEEENEKEEVEEEIEEPEEKIEESEIGQVVGQKLCEKISGSSSLKNKIIFNEIAWMGSVSSANDEWIELKNISGSEIDLAGWQILSKSNNIKFVFPKGANLLLSGFLLLERTDDNSVPGVIADFIYTGALKNNDEAVYLFDENCQLQDEITANPNWLAGDNSSKRTMEIGVRPGSGLGLTLQQWQSSQNPGGTPKAENSSGYVVSSGGGAPPPSPPLSPPSYPKILISEIQISPIAERFIELYNSSDENLNLTGWYIQRKTETGADWTSLVSSTYFEGKIINSGSHFLIASSSEADIVLRPTLTENNSLVLKNPDREITDLVGWGNAQDFETATATSPQEGQSIGRKWSTTTENYIETDNNQNDFEIQNPTPKSQNQSPSPEPEPEPEPEEMPLLFVAINEIAWSGTKANSSDEWIELSNNSSATIDLNNWTLTWSHATTTHTITFSAAETGTTTILGYDFYLIERTDDNTVSDVPADWFGSFGNGLNNDGEKLELKDDDNNLIDLVDCSSGWFSGSSSPDYISMERINPNSTGTLSENWANNNQQIRNGLSAEKEGVKYEINGTPKSQNSVYQSLPPDSVSDLSVDSQNSFGNRITLTWSTSTDPDTLSENLSYKIYYSKEAINEDNLENASSSLTTAVAITIFNLDYSSTYYFGLKVFDGQNYSALSNIISYQTATLSTVASGFPANLEIKNNGRKIARASDGNLYVVYSKNNKIFLAESSDQGINWTEIEATPQEELEQTNPSIAIDSQSNLHLVWQGKVATPTPYQIRYRKYDGNSFSEIETLTNNAEWGQEMPSIAMDFNDNVHIVWVNNQQRICSPQGDCYPAPQILYRAFINNEWQATETTGNFAEFAIYSLTLTADISGGIHLVWQAGLQSGPSWYTAILYQKRTDGWGERREIDRDSLQGEQSSIAIDSNHNLHIVWQSTGSYCDPERAFHFFYIKYVQYHRDIDSWDEVEKLVENCRYNVISPSVAVNSDDYLYVVWRGASGSGFDEIHQARYSDSWDSVKALLTTAQQNYLKQLNLLWSFYPIVEGTKTNQPSIGYGFVFYEGTEMKFYASQDLVFE